MNKDGMEIFHKLFDEHRERLRRPRAERNLGDWLACKEIEDLYAEAVRAPPS